MKQDSSFNLLGDLGRGQGVGVELESRAHKGLWWGTLLLDLTLPAQDVSDSAATLHTSLQERAADLAICTKFSRHLLKPFPPPHIQKVAQTEGGRRDHSRAPSPGGGQVQLGTFPELLSECQSLPKMQEVSTQQLPSPAIHQTRGLGSPAKLT